MTRRPLAALLAWRPPLGFPLRPSLPPQQPVIAGGDTGGEGSGGAAIEGDGSGGAATGGTDSEGAASLGDIGAEGDPAGGPGAGQPQQPGLLETLSPQQILSFKSIIHAQLIMIFFAILLQEHSYGLGHGWVLI
ncbi:unnamed protein product [Closterium sp. NIES-53]